MTIETKLAPGETGWMMHENRAIEVTVSSVEAISFLEGQFQATKTEVAYVVNIKGRDTRVDEDRLFLTKQALLDSL